MPEVPHGWHAITPDQILAKKGGNVIAEWMRDDAKLGVQVEVVPSQFTSGDSLKVNTWNNGTDEYDYDNGLPDFHSKRRAIQAARKWMRSHRTKS